MLHFIRQAGAVLMAALLAGCIPGAASGPLRTTAEPSERAPTPSALNAGAAAAASPGPTAIIGVANPLTGLPVEDPSLLELPAVLVSISHFPVTARPQAGLSFAPEVFEIYITEGATRFLTVFYGEFPEPDVPLTGGCEVRRAIFVQSVLMLGGRSWIDANANGRAEAWERGIGGVCVNLLDAAGAWLQQATTDSNGYYGFNVEPGRYVVHFVQPAGMEFSLPNASDEHNDSDADPGTGLSRTLEASASLNTVDAGLVPVAVPRPAPTLFPEAKVGPVRSGRLIYADIAGFFPDSCLIYAFASPEVLEHLPVCAFVTHDIQGGGYMLDIEEMKRLALDSRGDDGRIDYASNIHDPIPPAGGMPASRLHVFIAWLNQSAWKYDPLSESWWRYVDDADPQTAGYVHPEVDRLTGRQLQFENVIVLFAHHDVISPTNLDIHLEQDWLGDALLFRDGRMYEVRWSTVPTQGERESGRRKPIRFLQPDESAPFPLKPGRTWILVVTPETAVTERAEAGWLLQFHQPPGAK